MRAPSKTARLSNRSDRFGSEDSYVEVERRGWGRPCAIAAVTASLDALRVFAWRRLLSLFLAFTRRAPILILLSGSNGTDARLIGSK
jgi:hypothetical protein